MRQNSVATFQIFREENLEEIKSKGDEITRKMSDYDRDDPMDFFNLAKPRTKVLKIYFLLTICVCL
jgi:hypothetical protein